MLEQILAHLNNWFLVPNGVFQDEYAISNGTIELPFLRPGQYFRIIGSVFNDGLHQYPADDLTDETFDGAIWALAVPPAVVALSEEIKAWADKNQPSAYTSESFGGYSYSKATGSNGAPMGWQDVFRAQLNPYRKIRETSYVQGRRPIRAYQRPWNTDYPLGGDF